MSLDRRLSTLELTVLGVVYKRGPCTGYAVVSEFFGSAGSAYRSGASSVYPLLSRMESAGLVHSKTSQRRGEKLFEITDEGLTELRAWFKFTRTDEDFTSALDVIRSRIYFLKCLSPQEREKFFEDAMAGLKRLLDQCLAQVRIYEAAGDPFSTMAMQGAVMETKARIQWLRHCREAARNLP